MNGTGIIQQYSPFDGRLFASFGPWYQIAPADTICLDLALVFARDTLGDNLTSVTALKQKAAAVKAWYDQSGLSCTQDVALGAPSLKHPIIQGLTVSPNPATDQVRVTLGTTNGGELRILSPTGQVVQVQRYAAHTATLDVDMSGLPNGTYLLQALGATEVRSGRLVLLH